MTHTYHIPGAPIPLARARHHCKTVYDPQKKLKEPIALILKTQHQKSLLTGPLAINLLFNMPIPKSHSLKKQTALINQPHIFKPDLSNLVKFIEDICTGIIYTDDCILYHISATKQYAQAPSTILTITGLCNEKKETN